MLLATPGQTYVCSHAPGSVPINSSGGNSNNNGSISCNHTKSHKLGRATYKLIESSQNNTTAAATSTTTTTQAAMLMKTIAGRANRNSGFHSVTQSVPAANFKSNATVIVNDNGLNCVRKPIVAATINANSKSHTKQTASALPSSSTTNLKSNALAATTTSTTSSSSTSSSSALLSSSTKVVLSASFIKTYTVPPTDLHRNSAARSRSYSVDSLYDEMCHFKPIRSVSTTPWKCGSKSRGATIKAPKACLGQRTSNCDVVFNTPRTRKDLKRDCSKAKAKVKPKLSANLFPSLKPHPSAFVRLLLPMCSYTIPSSTQRICKRLQTSKPPETGKQEINVKKTPKTTKKQPKSKSVKKQPQKAPMKINKIENAAKNAKLSNTKKRKAQTQPKKCESTISKKAKIDDVTRKSPPLTRRRIRMDENCKLYGPLA